MSVRGVGRLFGIAMAAAAVALVAGCGQQSTGPAPHGNTADSKEAPKLGDIRPLPPYIELAPQVTATDPNKPSPAPNDTTWCVRTAQAEFFGGERYAGTDPFALGQRLYVEAWLKS